MILQLQVWKLSTKYMKGNMQLEDNRYHSGNKRLSVKHNKALTDVVLSKLQKAGCKLGKKVRILENETLNEWEKHSGRNNSTVT